MLFKQLAFYPFAFNYYLLPTRNKLFLSYFFYLIQNLIGVLLHKLSYRNEFDLQENKHARESCFHKKGWALRLVLKQRLKKLENGLFKQEFTNPDC